MPRMMHNSRLLGFDEPERIRIGWTEVRRHAERDGLSAFGVWDELSLSIA